MEIFKKTLNRHTIYCPACGEELCFFGLGGSKYYLHCPSCWGFYEKEGAEVRISADSEKMYRFQVEEGLYAEGHTGLESSIAFKPKWVKAVEKYR